MSEVMMPSEVVDAIADLGTTVWDTLLDAGLESYHRTGDGFDVYHPYGETAETVHVLVKDVRNGILRGAGGWRHMNAQRLAPCERALTATGLTVARLERDGGLVALVVGRDAESAAQAVRNLADVSPQGGESA
ncbi:hypothetical protein ACIBCT_20710 [Streptosporangium sp. NPDC050855]|uniref:hypothetical protein n=1 Tax=Streptosporangium sp. NPDC050855 TaxID=3366194 RepID=UPI0037A4E06D